MDVEQAALEFGKRRATYERFTLKFRDAVEELLDQKRIPFAQVDARTETVERFREKLTFGKSYSQPLSQITDLCQVRIVLRLQSDLDRVVDLLRAEFSIDEENSAYKAKELNIDQFGYNPIHLVMTAKAPRLSLAEWQPFAGLKVEVQIRTILQHAWATIWHAYDYRVEADVPRELRRRLFRVNTLIESADDELDRFADDNEQVIKHYSASLMAGNEQIELNVDSLRAFIETSPEVQHWNEYLSRHAQTKAGVADLSRNIRLARFCGLSTVDQIARLLKDAHGWGERFLDEYFGTMSRLFNIAPGRMFTPADGVVTFLLIATYFEKFTQEILDRDFGFGSTFILDAARTTRPR